MSYLAAHDEFGNTAISPGPLISSTPIDVVVQQGKYRLSEVGLRYSLDQTFTFASMTDVMQGDNALGFYTLNFEGKWAVFSTADSGAAGWIKRADRSSGRTWRRWPHAIRQRNLGSLTDPTGIWSGVNGVWIQELAWQQSFLNGEFVALIGHRQPGELPRREQLCQQWTRPIPQLRAHQQHGAPVAEL
jgi:hypothetical protein